MNKIEIEGNIKYTTLEKFLLNIEATYQKTVKAKKCFKTLVFLIICKNEKDKTIPERKANFFFRIDSITVASILSSLNFQSSENATT